MTQSQRIVVITEERERERFRTLLDKIADDSHRMVSTQEIVLVEDELWKFELGVPGTTNSYDAAVIKRCTHYWQGKVQYNGRVYDHHNVLPWCDATDGRNGPPKNSDWFIPEFSNLIRQNAIDDLFEKTRVYGIEGGHSMAAWKEKEDTTNDFDSVYSVQVKGQIPWRDQRMPNFCRIGNGKLFEYVKRHGTATFEKRTIIEARFSVIADFYV